MYRSAMTGWLSCEEAVRAHIDDGVPAEKLVLGMPFYGRGKEPLANFVDYSDIIALGSEYTREWDEEAQSPYITYDGKVVCTYDTPQSIAVKCSYIREAGMKGAMYWDYDGDDAAGTLRKAVHKGIFNSKTN